MAAGADRGNEGHAVFVRGAGFEQFAGDAAGQFGDFLRVAIVDLEDGGAALGLDAEALEVEFAALFAAVDGLGVVVEDEQRVGARLTIWATSLSSRRYARRRSPPVMRETQVPIAGISAAKAAPLCFCNR